MNIEEAQAAREALREIITLALEKFTTETGLLVRDLKMNSVRGPEGGIYWVDAEVRL
jgi:hypothetical protein